METRIQKWGNSLGVRLPKELTKEVNFAEGVCVDVEKEKMGILIKHCKRKTPKLIDLVRNIKVQNVHKEVDWGNSSGKEIW